MSALKIRNLFLLFIEDIAVKNVLSNSICYLKVTKHKFMHYCKFVITLLYKHKKFTVIKHKSYFRTEYKQALIGQHRHLIRF